MKVLVTVVLIALLCGCNGVVTATRSTIPGTETIANNDAIASAERDETLSIKSATATEPMRR